MSPEQDQPAAPLDWLQARLQELHTDNRMRQLRIRESPHVGGMIQMDGQQMVDFGSNDYLGIAADPRLVEAVRRAVSEHGWGSGASPLVSGHGVLHEKLERELATFEGTEACVLFPSGFAANLAAITSVCGPGDLILSDRLNHASIIDGCRLSRATVRVYGHCDAADLQQQLRDRNSFGRALIVTDSLFSMDGDLAPLEKLADIRQRFGCMLMVDEAHATGVLGATGRGWAEAAGVEAAIDIRVGTLSKALGSVGGFVSGSRQLTEWIRNRGRSYIYSTAMPGAAAAAGLAALQIVRDEPARRNRLMEHVESLGLLLTEPGPVPATARASAFLVPNSPATQIVIVMAGAGQRALKWSSALREQGLFVPAIRPPTVPVDQSRLRISISSAHTPEQIRRLADAIQKLFAEESGPDETC